MNDWYTNGVFYIQLIITDYIHLVFGSVALISHFLLPDGFIGLNASILIDVRNFVPNRKLNEATSQH